MKKKITKLLKKIYILLLITISNIPFEVSAITSTGCSNAQLYYFIVIIKKSFIILCIIIPIILIVSVTVKIIKLISNPEDKKAKKNLINSIVAATIVFFIPTLVNVIINTTTKYTNDDTSFNFGACWQSADNNKQNFNENNNYINIGNDKQTQIINGSSEYEKGSKKNDSNSLNNNSSKSNNNSNSKSNNNVESSYGVFLGLDHSSGLSKLYNYKLVVIDLQEFTKSDIKKLHKKGIKVYSYLNIGSVEEYRSYFKKYKNIYLGKYKNWEDERWVDVSNSSFQKFIINDLEPSLRAKGADGYFIDNCDVYANFKKDKIYNGLKKILGNIHKRNLTILINGGDEFVTRAINEGTYNNLFDGVNQEEVFTVINFDNYTYHNQSKSESEYYKKYLNVVKSKNLQVYLLEYGANSKTLHEIKSYCSSNGFSYYNSKSYNLD